MDLVNDEVYTKFGLYSVNSFLRHWEKKSDVNQGSSPFCKLAKNNDLYHRLKDLVNENEYTKFSLILSIRSQDIE